MMKHWECKLKPTKSKLKEGKMTVQFQIPEVDKKAVLQILKKLGLNPGRDYDFGVGKGTTFVLELDSNYRDKFLELAIQHRIGVRS